MTTYNCHHLVLFGDLNQHRVYSVLDEFMTVHDLQNFVNFPTHRSGSSLHPVVTGLPSHSVKEDRGTSDNEAVLTKISLRTLRKDKNDMEVGEYKLDRIQRGSASYKMG